MGRQALKLVGKKFGRLLVLKRIGSIGKNANWECICDCGNSKTSTTKHLMGGNTNSCGCIFIEYNKSAKVHGFTKKGTKQITEYYAWSSMKDRCLREKHPAYDRYGGRGIKICKRWLNSFKNFLDDMGYKPEKHLTLDRIDNNKGYYKENCRWASKDIQNSNRKNTPLIQYRGVLLTKAAWARLILIPSGNLCSQLKRKTIEEIILYYEKKRNCIIL
ncbi:MAG: hypothetical protein ABIP51_22665 [Bacteroidia bacterium]